MKVSVRYSGLVVGALLAVGVSSVAMGMSFAPGAYSGLGKIVPMNTSNNSLLRDNAASIARSTQGYASFRARWGNSQNSITTRGGPVRIRHGNRNTVTTQDGVARVVFYRQRPSSSAASTGDAVSFERVFFQSYTGVPAKCFGDDCEG